MAESFPRPKLNPAAQPWARAVEKRVLNTESNAEMLLQRVLAVQRKIGARQATGADGDVYRRNGIVVPAGSGDFTVFSGATGDDTDQYGSLNVYPGYAQMRTQNNDNAVDFDLPDGIARLTPTSFEVGHGVISDHVFDNSDGANRILGLNTAIYYGWRGAGIDVHSNLRDLILGNGFYTQSDTQYGVSVFEIEDWLKGEVLVDPSDGTRTRRLTFFGGSQTVSDDGGGTIGGTPDATTTVKGKVRFATDDEAAAGTVTDAVVSPAQLATAGRNLADTWRGEWVAP